MGAGWARPRFFERNEMKNWLKAMLARLRQWVNKEEPTSGRFSEVVLRYARNQRFTSFTARELAGLMAETGYTFRAKNPPLAVNDALRRLTKAGRVELAVEGRGRTPNLYRSK